ncbi:Sodium/hydrogen exchanger [Aphelenchoides bicaudatus]|nr:Sodium/hydrogen exchanger [Aphelenchoides bicaudatus]
MNLQFLWDWATRLTEISTHSNKVPIIGKHNADHESQKHSLEIFFILLIIIFAILIVHAILTMKFHYMPESLAIVLLGALIGFTLSYSKWDFHEFEAFNPNFFFLVLLPPIIFESGYTVNKGHFFSNIVPIFTFAIFGTLITAAIISLGIYFLGANGTIYQLTLIECVVFGSILSAIDPVITLAIFQALKVNPRLYIMIFGESMLNDAVSVVLVSTALEMNALDISQFTTFGVCRYAIYRFMVMFFVSAILGCAIGLISSLIHKYIHLRRTPALEMSLLLVFSYLPYGLAEVLSLSGIMSILFCAITMSHYTHKQLTPTTQLSIKMMLRTLSFVAETCTFAYLGLALFSIKLVFQPMFLLCSVALMFVSRAANIFPLSFLFNRCSRNKISTKNQVIMWFSGMRGAVAFALALHVNVGNVANKQILLTSTLFVVLFTIVFMGGSVLPLIKILNKVFPDKEDARIKSCESGRKEFDDSDETDLFRQSNLIMLSKTYTLEHEFDESHLNNSVLIS